MEHKGGLLGLLKRYGACDVLKSEGQIEGLLFSARGVEFLVSSEIPLPYFRSYAVKGVYVESTVEIENECVVLVGARAKVVLNNAHRVYKVVLLHGASAKIVACNYAVVEITRVSGRYELVKDSTVIVL